MRVDVIINLLATTGLFCMMVMVGTMLTLTELWSVLRDWRLAIRVGIANYLLAPAAAMWLLSLLQPKPMVAVGFLVAVVCPGAPFSPVLVAMARGEVAAATATMAMLAGSSIIFAPLILRFLLPAVVGHSDLAINPMSFVSVLILSQFLPLSIGLGLRRMKPLLAQRIRVPLNRAALLLNLGLVILIFIVQFKLLRQIHLVGYLGMAAMVGFTLLAGWLAGGSKNRQPRTMAITTAARNVGLALVIVASSFPGTAAVSAATVFALFQIAAVVLAAVTWRQFSSSTQLACNTPD